MAVLADSSAASFQSYHVPDRYPRHHDHLLRPDPISTGTDRAEAAVRTAG